MSFRELLDVGRDFARIEYALADRFPPLRGLLVLDMYGDESALFHLRPFLQHGLQVEPAAHGVLDSLVGSLSPSAGYLLAALRRAEDLRFSPPALSIVDRADQRSFPTVTFELAGSGVRLLIDGVHVELPALPGERRLSPVPVEVHGQTRQTGTFLFPFEVMVHKGMDGSRIQVSVKHDAIADVTQKLVLRSSDGQPAGDGSLLVGLDLHPARQDRVVIQPRFERSVELKPPPATPPPRSPLALHILFDRTTLDIGAWDNARKTVAALSKKIDEKLMEGDVHTGPAEWNRQLRSDVAAGVAAGVEQVASRKPLLAIVSFADRERDIGIRAIDDLPLPEAVLPSGPPSRNLNIDGLINSELCSWQPGLDLFDAVDEALKTVVETLSKKYQHAVMIIGDSPPPPSGPSDPLWQELVLKPVRSNARTSPLFNEALESLKTRQIPVVWIFPRPDIFPAYTDYPAFSNMRNSVYNALLKIPDIDLRMTSSGQALQDEIRDTIVALARRASGDRPQVNLVQQVTP